MPSSNLFGSTSVSTIASCIVNSLYAIRATATPNFVADVGTESFSSLNRASYYPNGSVRLHATEDRRTRRHNADSEQIRWTSIDNGTPVFTSCGVSVQPTRPRITFGEL